MVINKIIESIKEKNPHGTWTLPEVINYIVDDKRFTPYIDIRGSDIMIDGYINFEELEALYLGWLHERGTMHG